mmetsp:Transcript_24318/g.78100  ORF Transcript_24318/g.78100 Transcript_24318/m.78100 type:complete len:346 (+) Transcript_24318:179-1216(+)|eukprot:CAMPEP_0196779812 /NCGR_PEP_ID=MMETSP1104-20130614/6598_1 /TAXON_ID=33652 /ORGANISM="Cafeteria sp., Strain Caron Lab Isolate" /LENGTH=345 /DNA_ID=CAMNT_0042149995 /DNA_START=161 /DNA_END=1198 /DNA_ORIENTATION=+
MLRVGVLCQETAFAGAALSQLLRSSGLSNAWEVVFLLNGLRRGAKASDSWARSTPCPVPPRAAALSTPLPRPALSEGAAASADAALCEDCAPLRVPGVVEQALEHDVPTFLTNNVNRSGALSALKGADLDLIVCFGFDRIFSPKVLSIPRLGGVNSHPSLLPKLRGPAPLFWTLHDRWPELWMTLHELTPKLDAGAILDQQPFQVLPTAPGKEILAKAGEVAGSMARKLLDRTAERPQELAGSRMMQRDEEASSARMPTFQDALVRDPRAWAADDLARFVNGGSIYQAPWMVTRDGVLHMKRASAVALGDKLPSGSTCVCAGDDTFFVQCGDGVATVHSQHAAAE